jgi:hypothetical protein
MRSGGLDGFDFYIHNEIISNHSRYYSRWWRFCEDIQSKNYYDEEYFIKFRKDVMKDTLALGGKKVYFVNDQCNHLKGVGQGDEMEYNWKELQKYIHSRKGLNVISISKTILDLNYRLNLIYKKLETLAFFDNFKDISLDK